MTPVEITPPESPVIENAFIERLASRFRRSPDQVNALNASDAELIRLGDSLILAVTTDAIVEEIESGLYADPWLLGWMTVVVNASDLAAVGAEPVGILLNQTFPSGCDEGWLSRLEEGVNAASQAARLPVLGGDVNFSLRPLMAGTAIGVVTGGPPLTRRGGAPGERLMATGKLGAGGAFALERLTGRGKTPLAYRPTPRLREGWLLRNFATCCMDTSDGLIPALDQLARLNDVGFSLEGPGAACLDPAAMEVARGAGIEDWMLLAGPHGEFELVFTVPAPRIPALRSAAAAIGWEPIELGAVTQGPAITIERFGRRYAIDSAAVRNLAARAATDPPGYISALGRTLAPVEGGNREV